MNREETKREVERLEKLLPVMKAFAEGKKITCDGQPNNDFRWNAKPERYAIVEQPQYVPFESAEEFLEALAKQKIPLIRFPDGKYHGIASVGDLEVHSNDSWNSFAYLNCMCEFYDGTSCGKLKS